MPRKKPVAPDLNDAQKVDLQATRIFFENMMSDKEITINIGGGGSSKSHSIIQLLIYKLLTEKNKKILVLRKTMPSLRTSVLIPFYEIMEQFGVRDRIREDKVGMNLFFGNSMIHFNGLDNPEKVKSSSWNYMWFEEATDITENDFNTIRLYLRAPTIDKNKNKIFMSFNPIDEFHWIKEKLIDNPDFSKDIKVVHSTYKDNPFLDERSQERYEDLINQDINFYRIYALGEWGKLENLIYRNWNTVPTIPVDGKGLTLYGIDFGFNDPTVITKCIVKDKEVWVDEILYQSNMTNSQLISYMQDNIPRSDWSKPIYADAAEPQRIREIRLAGFNIKAAQKNVLDGIDMCKRLQFHVNERASNIVKEFRAYSWKTDRRGNIVDEPVDFLNHACVTPDTFITTINGPIKIRDIKIGDEVLTHTGKFKKVLEVMKREYKGEILRIRPSCRMPLFITPNHPVYTSEAKRSHNIENGKKLTGQLRQSNIFTFTNSQDLMISKKKTDNRTLLHSPIIKEGRKVILDMKHYFPNWVEIDNGRITPRKTFSDGSFIPNPIKKVPKIKRFIEINNEIAFMFGYFVAEGSKNGNREGDNRKSVNFAGHKREIKILDILEKAFDFFDVKHVYWKEKKDNNGRVIQINNAPIFEIVKECGKEENKRFPNFSYLLDKEKTLYLLAGYLFGDGCFVRDSIYSNTISPYIVYQINELYLKLGYKTRFREVFRKEGKNQFVIDITQNDSINLLNEMIKHEDLAFVFEDKRKKEFKKPKLSAYQSFISSDYSSCILREISKEPYNGEVYNLEVEDDHTYVANSVIVHNCDAVRYAIYSQFRGEGIYKVRWLKSK